MARTSSAAQVLILPSISDSLVSVILTTKNEEKNIENCLRSVKGQTFKNIELIVVDNFSEDKTVDIAKKYTGKIYSKASERSGGRNYGAQISNGKYLLFVDADMILSLNVIEECIKKCETNEVDLLYIPERIIGEGFWIKVRDFERSFYNGTVIDMVRFIRKDLFKKVGGFDENLFAAEDWDLDRRLRGIGRTGIINIPLCHNEGSFNLKGYLKKKQYYTAGIKGYTQKWGSKDSEIAKQTGAIYRLIGVFIENGKWKKLIHHPILTISMYYLRLRVAWTYIQSQNRSAVRLKTIKNVK